MENCNRNKNLPLNSLHTSFNYTYCA